MGFPVTLVARGCLYRVHRCRRCGLVTHFLIRVRRRKNLQVRVPRWCVRDQLHRLVTLMITGFAGAGPLVGAPVDAGGVVLGGGALVLPGEGAGADVMVRPPPTPLPVPPVVSPAPGDAGRA